MATSTAGNKRLRRVSLPVKYPKPTPPPEPAILQLRTLMRKHKLTTGEIAFVLDLKPQTIRAYLCGVRAIPAEHLDTIRRAAGVA